MIKQKKRVPGEHTANFEMIGQHEDTNNFDKNKENLIFQYLLTGARIDQFSAKRIFNCANIHQVISQIKQSGSEVVTRELWTGKNTMIFQYHLKLHNK
jgi:hypothetical protein